MTYIFRRFAATILATLAFAMPASATSFSTDWTDLWFNPAEPGWGVNLIQQGNTIFATLFVYGPDQTARWYVASNLVGSTATSFSGPLYRTTGPFFGAAWTGGGPAVQVGNMSFNFNSPTTGTLIYSVDGVTITKSVQRQTFVGNSLTGIFVGGVTARASTCVDDTVQIFAFDVLTVVHSLSNAINLRVNFSIGGQPLSCTFIGTYTQAGKLGNVAGTWSCTTGNAGSFTIAQIDASVTGWTGVFTGNDQFCASYNGYFGGVRDVQ